MCINDGYVNIPMKHGITMIVPAMNHGILFPHGVLILSLRKPTMGVVIPSANCPESMQ